MTRSRLLRIALPGTLLASLGLAGCRQREQAESPPPATNATPAQNEMPVETTPVESLYEEKPGVLYEQPVRSPTITPPKRTPTRTPAPWSP